MSPVEFSLDLLSAIICLLYGLPVVFDKNNDQAEADAKVMQPIMQLKAEVTQQHSENDVETRISKLESEIGAIKKLIYRITDTRNEKNTNKALELKQIPRACGLAGYDVGVLLRQSDLLISNVAFRV